MPTAGKKIWIFDMLRQSFTITVKDRIPPLGTRIIHRCWTALGMCTFLTMMSLATVEEWFWNRRFGPFYLRDILTEFKKEKTLNESVRSCWKNVWSAIRIWQYLNAWFMELLSDSLLRTEPLGFCRILHYWYGKRTREESTDSQPCYEYYVLSSRT